MDQHSSTPIIHLSKQPLISTVARLGSTQRHRGWQQEPWWCKRCHDTWPPGRSLCPERPQDRDLPPGTTPGLSLCRPAVSTPPAPRVLGRVLAAGLTTGRRTRPHGLRTVRSQAPGPGASEPRVWSPRCWSTGGLAPALLTCRRDRVVPPGPVWRAGDETVTEPPHVFGTGRHRDGVRSPPSDPRPAGAIRGASGRCS